MTPGTVDVVSTREFAAPNERVRDQSKAGLEQCLDKMAALVENSSAQA